LRARRYVRQQPLALKKITVSSSKIRKLNRVIPIGASKSLRVGELQFWSDHLPVCAALTVAAHMPQHLAAISAAEKKPARHGKMATMPIKPAADLTLYTN
jgi:hypothetical protein